MGKLEPEQSELNENNETANNWTKSED